MATDLPQRLAAILAADIAGYTRLMELDEAGTVGAWRRARTEVIDPTVAQHQGRIVKLTGDGFLAEFSTAESAVNAALAMQRAFAALFADTPAERRVAFRIGVNVGDVWVDSEDIYGAGVNVAARLEALAEPGGLCIAGAVHDVVKHKVVAQYEDMGRQVVKNVAEPIQAWRVRRLPPTGRTLGPDAPMRSGEKGQLPHALAWPLFGIVIVGLLVAATYTGDALQIEPSQLPNPPQVLTQRAQEILARIGHDGARVDSAVWFVAELPSDEASSAPNAAIHGLRFVYRQSPLYLVPQNLFRFVTQDDPAPSVPGMASVTTDAEGRLVRFDAVRVATEQAPLPVTPEWAVLFGAAGLSLHEFREVAPYRSAPVPHDRQFAWERRNDAFQPLFVTAAALGGKAVYFEASSSQSQPAYRAPRPSSPPWPALVERLIWLAIVIAFVVAAMMARFNLRRGEGDRRGAFRLSVFVVAAGELSEILRAHHVPMAIDEVTFVLSTIGWSLAWGSFVWLIYIGLEPHVRRIWPRMLTSWIKLVAGRFRDPMVGRDVLVGLAVGVALVAARLFTDELLPNHQLVRALESLRSVPAFSHALVSITVDAVQTALGGLFFLLLIRAIARNTWVAGAVMCVLLAPYASEGTALVSWELGANALLISIVMITVLLRLGLVAYAATLFAHFLLSRLPLTLDIGAWYFGWSTVTLGIVASLAAFACVVALGPGMLSPDASRKGPSQKPTP